MQPDAVGRKRGSTSGRRVAKVWMSPFSWKIIATLTSFDPWINKYIFPNGCLPSVRQIAEASESHFVMEDWHAFLVPAFHAGESYFPLANVGLISDHIFSCSQYAFYGIDNRLRLRIDLDIHTLRMRCTQKRVGVTSPTVKLMPSTPIKPLYRIYFIRDASCTLNHT